MLIQYSIFDPLKKNALHCTLCFFFIIQLRHWVVNHYFLSLKFPQQLNNSKYFSNLSFPYDSSNANIQKKTTFNIHSQKQKALIAKKSFNISGFNLPKYPFDHLNSSRNRSPGCNQKFISKKSEL